MPPLTGPVFLDVYCLVPYRPKELRKDAPPSEEAGRNAELVWAFKNGRAMRKRRGGRHSLAELIGRIVSACGESPLGKAASDTAWMPVPRSGASQPSKDPGGDPFPCLTLAKAIAERLGGSVSNPLARHSPLTKKRDVEAGIANLELAEPLPSSPTTVLIDDMCTTGSTLASCAAFLRKHGYEGAIAAFCIAFDVAKGAASEAQPNKTRWQLEWQTHWRRSTLKRVGLWGQGKR